MPSANGGGDREFGERVRKRREELGWTQERLAEVADVSYRTIGEIENSSRKFKDITLKSVEAALWGSTPHQTPIPDADLQLLETMRKLNAPARNALRTLMSEILGSVAQVNVVDELAERRTRPMRLVGYVAAKEESATIDFSDRLGDELPVPEEDWAENRSLVRVRGDSMRECEISGKAVTDKALLLVEPVEIGQYRKGDVVIAKTPEGQVCKRYAGQGSAAHPKRPAGIIVLESCSPDGKTIVAPLESDEQPGIRVQAKVVKVITE